MNRRLVVIASACLLLGGCSSEATPASQNRVVSTNSSAPASTQTTAAVALRIKAEIPQAAEIIEITEDNDGNDLIGRPNGYSQATVVVDKRAECAGSPGVACGAVLEMWPSEAAANKRRDYIQSLLKESPILGSEYDTVKGSMLLRVSGDLKPTAAKEYEETFEAAA